MQPNELVAVFILMSVSVTNANSSEFPRLNERIAGNRRWHRGAVIVGIKTGYSQATCFDLISTHYCGYNFGTMPERLQKILAQSGYGSCRASEDFISAGRVRVNGQIAILGQKADASKDKITVDGKLIAAAESLTYIALYKPRNVLSTVEHERGDTRQTVRELVDAPGHLYPVGRLDFESEGLVLMTNEGELTNQLTHPRFGHENS